MRHGRRPWRKPRGAPVGCTVTGIHVLAEHDAASGAAGLEYIWLDEKLIGMATFSGGSPTTRFVTTGQIDEPLLVTQNNQTTYWSGYLDPLGNAATFGTALSRINLRFPGQWFQAEASVSGLHQNGWRDYDPTLGRYIETDPLGVDAGADVYAYVDGDPLNASDPTGLGPAGAAIGGWIGGGLAGGAGIETGPGEGIIIPAGEEIGSLVGSALEDAAKAAAAAKSKAKQCSPPHPAQCAVQYDSDSRVCRTLPTPQQRHACWESAAKREAYCISSGGEVGWPPLRRR